MVKMNVDFFRAQPSSGEIFESGRIVLLKNDYHGISETDYEMFNKLEEIRPKIEKLLTRNSIRTYKKNWLKKGNETLNWFPSHNRKRSTKL